MADLAAKARKLVDEAGSLLTLVRQRGGLLAGSLYTSRTRCGRKACKCMASDYRHENCCLSFCEDGKSRTRTVPEHLLKSIHEQTAAYRTAKARRREITRSAKELLKSVDDAIALAAGRGQKALLASLARSKGGAK